MRLEDLATFVEAVDAGSLLGAGRRLGVPKSTVSRRVARLEAELGEELVVRSARRFELTDVGRGLYARAAGAVAELRRAAREVRDAHDDLAGELRLSLPPDLGIAEPIVQVLTSFRRAHPEITLHVDLSDRRVDLVAERFDVAFRVAMGPLASTDALKASRLGPVGGGLFASPDYLARAGEPSCPEELVGHDAVALHRGEGPLGLTLRHTTTGETRRVLLRGALTASSMTFPPVAAAAGAGVAYVPGFAAAARVAAGELVRVLPDWETEPATLWLVWPASRLPHPRRRLFLAWCRERLERSLPAPA